MDYLYSLYDALISIDVPNDKARAVVDAMERDMSTTIATKTDLNQLRDNTKAEFQLLRQDMKAEIQLLRQEVQFALAAVATRDELQAVKAELKSYIAELHQDNRQIHSELELLASRMTIRLGSVLFVGFGAVLAMLRLFPT